MSKSRDIADSAATINYIDGLTSDAQSQLNDKATLDGSPTFTGTVTATACSGDGSGLTGVDSLPSQTGNNGLFLTTDGSTASWAEAGGGAWELLSTATPSASASIDFTSIPTGYLQYMITGYIVPSSNTRLAARFYVGGSVVSTGSYYNIMTRLTTGSTNSTTYDVNVSDSLSYLLITPSNATTLIRPNNACYFSFKFVADSYSNNSSNTVPFFTEAQYYNDSNNYHINVRGGGSFVSSNDIDGVKLIDVLGGGLNGFVNLYGLKKS